MLSLVDYINKNRTNTPVIVQDEWYGELYINTRAIYYDVPMLGGAKRIFSFVSFPTTPMPKNGYPAVLLIHGGNGSAFYEMSKVWADKGFVAIAPDFNGKCARSIDDRQVDNPDGGNEGYGSIDDLHDENPWAYFSVLSAMRAIDVLSSLNNVDKNNVFSCGLSWGGFIQLLLSSVDKRIKASSVIYSSAFLIQSDWGNAKFADIAQEDKKLWDTYIDPKNYIEDISHPIFFTAGADDIAFKMDCRQKTADKINSKVYYGIRRNFPHGNFYGFEQPESVVFFDKIIKGEEIPQPKVNIEEFEVKVDNLAEDAKTCLCFTHDNLFIADKQTWEEIEFVDTIKIPKGSTGVFIVMKLPNGTQWSSKLFYIN